MFALLFLVAIATEPAEPSLGEPLIVLRFSDWPPKHEEDQARAHQMKLLMGLDMCKCKLELAKDGTLEVRIWIVDDRVFEIVATTLEESDPKWKEVTAQFPDLKIAISRGNAFVLGPSARVRAFKAAIKDYLKPTEGKALDK